MGPRIGELFQHRLKKTNLEFRKQLPKEAIANFAEAQFDEGVNMIFVAHFHQDYRYRKRQAQGLYVLSGWYNTKQVTLYEAASKEIRSLHWREIGRLNRMATENTT